MFDPTRISGSRSLHDRKLATWALLIGETYSSAVHAEVRRKPHRGMLPDVDFSRAVPDFSRPSLVRRLIRMIRPSGARTSGAKTGGSETASQEPAGAPVGEMPRTSYIARDKASAPDDSSGVGNAGIVQARAA